LEMGVEDEQGRGGVERTQKKPFEGKRTAGIGPQGVATQRTLTGERRKKLLTELRMDVKEPTGRKKALKET